MPAITLTWEKEFGVVQPQITADGTHVYPFDPSFPIDVRFFIGRGGHHCVRMNRHRYFELCYVSEGTTTVQVQDRILPAKKGDLVVIGSDLYHRTTHPLNSQSRLTLLFFEPELIRATDGTVEEMEYLLPFLGQRPDFPHVIPAATGLPVEISGLVHRIHEELPAATVRARLAVKTYLKMALMLLLNHYTVYLSTCEEIDRKRADLKRLRLLFDHLERHYDSLILVEDAARICAMSNSHFMYFFKRVTGQSFLSYLNSFRIAKAQILLTTTDKSLASISQEVAFCNQSYFGMVFRKLVGVTPLSYRRQSGKGGDIGHVPVQSRSSEVNVTGAARAQSVVAEDVCAPNLPSCERLPIRSTKADSVSSSTVYSEQRLGLGARRRHSRSTA